MFDWLRSVLPHLPHYGYVLVFIVVFLNNLGFPLPGETILLGAGFVLGRVALPLWPPMAAAAAACFLGGICAFWIGRRLGLSGLERFPWLHLTRARLEWPERFFARHGAKSVFAARFIALFPPVFANLLAGMSKIRWGEFLFFNLTGSAAYAAVYILLGYFFGKQWRALRDWLGADTLHLIELGLALVALAVLGFVLRHRIAALCTRISLRKS